MYKRQVLGSGIGAAGAAGDTGLANVFGNVFDQAAGKLEQRALGRRFEPFTFADEFATTFAQAEKDAFLGTNESGLNEGITDLVRRTRSTTYQTRNQLGRRIPPHILASVGDQGAYENYGYNTDFSSSGRDTSELLVDPLRAGDTRGYEDAGYRVIYQDNRQFVVNSDVTTDSQVEDLISKTNANLDHRGALPGGLLPGGSL